MTRPSAAALVQYMCNPMHTALGIYLLRLVGAPAVAQPPPVLLHGQTVLVAGGTAGIGRAIAGALAAAGAEVHITGRTKEAGERAARELGCTAYHCVDHSNVHEVRRFAERFAIDTLGGRPLDCLVNNVAMMMNGFERTSEGHEKACALNLIGFHVLTTALLPALERSACARVVNVVSAGMLLFGLDTSALRDLDDGAAGWAAPGGYDAIRAYALTHRARVCLTAHWAEQQDARERAGSRAVRFSCAHPGWVETPGLRGADAMRAWYTLTRATLRTPAEGADTPVWLAAGLDRIGGAGARADKPVFAARNGAFYWDRAPRATHLPFARTAESADQLARLVEFCDARSRA
ncbi:hypothetical protein KFE25_004994 [Diacronema lutheri]|uniref:Uncharacterized protein n=1 Tax=Diacronema lutheri TaxID=2081491 RepID=A0A8J5XG64_DIALT|nr:hypothetical protein KFE25_004994 [Diacronema lutheri]